MQHRGWTEAVLATFIAVAVSTAPALAAGDKSDPSAMPGGAQGGDFTGRHTMSGEVTKVDTNKGTLTLKTPEGNLDLHFPPSALQNVKKGDRLSVELALKPDTASSTGGSQTGGSASPRTEPGAGQKGTGGGSQR